MECADRQLLCAASNPAHLLDMDRIWEFWLGSW